MLLGLLIAIISVISILSIIVYCLSKHKRIKRFKRLLILSNILLLSSVCAIRAKSNEMRIVSDYNSGYPVYQSYDLFNLFTGNSNTEVNEWDKKIYTLTNTVVVPNTQTLKVNGENIKIISNDFLDHKLIYKLKKPVCICVGTNIYVLLDCVDITKEDNYIVSYAKDDMKTMCVNNKEYNVYMSSSLKYGSATMVCI